MENRKRIAYALIRPALTGLFLCLACCFALSARAQDLEEYAREVIRLVNEERVNAGVPPLTENTELKAAADLRAQEASRRFSHTRPDGSQWKTVFAQYGFDASYRGENLAYGQKTPEKVVAAWKKSKGHRKNMLDSRFNEIAVGVYDKNGTLYWSQLFMENESPVAVQPNAEPEEEMAQTTPEGEIVQAYVDGVSLYLRSAPDSKADIIEVMEDGTHLRVLGVQDAWAQVELDDGRQGWASTKYLRMVGELGALGPPGRSRRYAVG